jgi:hypothetical protein
VLNVLFDATDILISLTVIGMAEDATAGITRRELLAKIVVGVLVYFLIPITTTIVVVIPTTMTTSVSTITVTTAVTTIAAAATATTVTTAAATRVDWGWTVVRIRCLLATWVF